MASINTNPRKNPYINPEIKASFLFLQKYPITNPAIPQGTRVRYCKNKSLAKTKPKMIPVMAAINILFKNRTNNLLDNYMVFESAQHEIH